jgi:hypothetical protein
MTERFTSEAADDLYLDIVDILARRGDQLQAKSGDRGSFGTVFLQDVILFVSGGLATAIIDSVGERSADAALNKVSAASRRFLKRVRGRASTEAEKPLAPGSERNDVEVDEPSSDAATLARTVAELAEVTRVLVERDYSSAWTAQQVCSLLREAGYTDQAAAELATQIAERLHQ